MSTNVTMFNAVASVKVKITVYFDAVAAIGMGNIRMREYEKCLLVQFDEPLDPKSCNDRGNWIVKKPDGTVTIPISVSLVSETHALLSLPSLVPETQYELAFTVIDSIGREVKGSVPFTGI